MHARINLVTQSDVIGFVAACTAVDAPIHLTDGNNLRVSAKSLLGALYTLEWNEVYCDCDADIYSKISKYIKEES